MNGVSNASTKIGQKTEFRRPGRRGPKPGTIPPPQSLANLRPPFRPGVSANPGGRPKDLFKPEVRRLAVLSKEKLEALGKGNPTAIEMGVLGMVKAAAKGNPSAFNALADRSDGRVPIAVTGAEGEPLIPLAVTDRIVALIEAAKARRK